MRVSVNMLRQDELAAAKAVLAATAPGLGLSAPEVALVAEEKLFGPGPGAPTQALAAHLDQTLVGVAAISARWLRVIAVHPRARQRGAGTALLKAAEAAAASAGASTLRTGDQPGNYLVPGIPAADGATARFFAGRGFAPVATHESLLADLSAAPAPVIPAGHAITRALPGHREPLCAAIAATFSPAWASEVAAAFAAHPVTVFVAHGEGAAAPPFSGFAAHSGHNRALGHFGPAAILDPAAAGAGLGTALVRTALADLAATGRRRTVIPWIGPRRFYARAVGIVGQQRYIVMAKSLPP